MEDIKTLISNCQKAAYAHTVKNPLPTLFILAHQDLSRIGEHCVCNELISKKTLNLSRTEPYFTPTNRPLADPYMSRSPIFITRKDNGDIFFSTENMNIDLVIARKKFTNQMIISAGLLNDGVTIEINQRITLLLKNSLPISPVDENNFSMVGISPELSEICHHIELLQDYDAPVLIQGETGTGKELVAQAIVNNSLRKDRSFISVNLGAIAPTLAAAELFGVTKGAFTGADKPKDGFFVAADGGTLFLDEIGEASTEVQAMLLRVLETGEIFPVGSSQPQRVNVRFIAATDANLTALTKDKNFKAPLLHRLSAIELKLPPLARRREDIGLLFNTFACQILKQLDMYPPTTGLDTPWIPAGLMALLANYDWPGNIRQLRNVISQIIIASKDKPILIAPVQLLNELQTDRSDTSSVQKTTGQPTTKQPKRKPFNINKTEFFETLQHNRFEIKSTAEQLQISRASVYELMNRYHIPGIRDIQAQVIIEQLQRHDGDIAMVAEELQVSAVALRRRVNDLKGNQ